MAPIQPHFITMNPEQSAPFNGSSLIWGILFEIWTTDLLILAKLDYEYEHTMSQQTTKGMTGAKRVTFS